MKQLTSVQTALQVDASATMQLLAGPWLVR
jgi:hypothetical protein